MAVRRWDLENEAVYPVRLELVPAPPRGGRVVPALLFVTLLIGAIGYPAIEAAIDGPPRILYETPRPISASQLAALDPVRPMPRGGWPTGSEPLGGILFVRCTNLWAARPDGSGARKLLDFPGVSSPALSPDARTIAFVGPADGGVALYMVGSDGSDLTRVGAIAAAGQPVLARVANLTWGAKASELAFALVDPRFDPMYSGSTIWTWDLSSGTMGRVASGYPTPGYLDGRVAYSEPVERSNDETASFVSSASRTARMMSSPDFDDLSFGTSPTSFSDSWATDHGAVVLRRAADGSVELAVKENVWTRRVADSYQAPSPYAFFAQGKVGVSQDARHATVDLVDPRGDRALGILDLRDGEWTVLDYAWSGVPTPVPTTEGPPGAERARRLAEDIFGSWRRRGGWTPAAIMIGKRDRASIDLPRANVAVGSPTRSGSGWRVPVTLYGGPRREQRFLTAALIVTATPDDRIEADVVDISPQYPLETIADVQGFVKSIVGDLYMWPTYLPEGTRVSPTWPVSAYSYDGTFTASVNFEMPLSAGRYTRTLSVAFGDVNFSLGCGDGGTTEPGIGDVGGQPALFDSMGEKQYRMTQVLWPATVDTMDGATHSVYGYLPRSEIQKIADSMSP